MLNSIVKVKKKYYPKAFLEECKFEIKKTKMENFINDDLEKAYLITLMMNLIMIQIIKLNLTMR